MARKEFKKEVAEAILIKSRRHCAVCDRWCGQNIEIHHIDSSEDNSKDNAIPVCFDCHATVGHYKGKWGQRANGARLDKWVFARKVKYPFVKPGTFFIEIR